MIQKTEAPIDAVTQLLKADIMSFGQLFFPLHFKKQSPKFHHKLIMYAQLFQFLAIASPRRSAKSTYLSFLYPMHKIMFREEPFIVLISNTFKKAAMYLDAIKMEFTDNELLKKSFPKIKFARDAEGDTIFESINGYKTLFLCKGVDQIGSLRGVKFGPHRPGLILLDDIEDDELVRSIERRNKLKEEFDEVLGRVGHDKTQIIAVGTILHDDSQLSKMVSADQYPKFKKVAFRAHINPDQADEASLWPEAWSLEDLKKLREEEPNVYAKEMQNDPVAGSNTRFKKEDFRYWTSDERGVTLSHAEGEMSRYAWTELKAAIACDLAWKEKRSNDDSVIMPGLLTPNSEILIDTYVKKKGMRPDETAEHLFMMVARLEKLTGSTVPVGFEKAMLENVTQWLLKREMKARNKFLMTKELVWDTDKNSRIETRLQPRYSQHVIFHKRNMGDLEYQLERFPSGVFDDLCLIGSTKIATLFGYKELSKIKIGDYVITPLGIKKVRNKMFNGIKKVMSYKQLTGTGNHKVFDYSNGFVRMDSLKGQDQVSVLTFKENLEWKYKKLFCSMELSTGSWGRENITSLSHVPMLDGGVLRDFMLRSGNMLMEKQLKKAGTFIIKMAILLITHLIIWSVFQLGNIIGFLKMSTIGKIMNILRKSDLLQKLGILLMKVWIGIKNTAKGVGIIRNTKNTNVNRAELYSNQEVLVNQNTAHARVTENLEEKQGNSQSKEHAVYVTDYFSFKTNTPEQNHAQQDAVQYWAIEKVYNITVEENGCYYAEDILVGNCDTAQGLVQLLQYPKNEHKAVKEDDAFEFHRNQLIQKKKPTGWKVSGSKHSRGDSFPAKISYR